MQTQRFSCAEGALSMPLRIALAASAAGGADLIYAFLINGAHGVPPGRVLQFIASGVLGPASFQYEFWSGWLGVVCHFALMSLFAAAVALLADSWPAARRHPWRLGAVTGLALYAMMTFVVVPLSQAPVLPPPPFYRQALEFLVHTALVGPIVALILTARRSPAGSAARAGVPGG